MCPDLDGDAVPDFVVGAPGYDGTAGPDSGLVAVLSGASGMTLWSIEGQAGSLLGWSVATAGDVDGDGLSDVIAGAPYHPGPSGERTGRAVVLAGATGLVLWTWDGEAGGGFGDTFGTAVSGGRDVDLDGRPDLLVGAPKHDGTMGEWSGKIYLFSGRSGALLRTTEGEQAVCLFGEALSCTGDLDGDSVADYLVGAPFFSTQFTYAGRAYAFSGATGAVIWSRDGDLSFTVLGSALSSLSDVDGDGLDEAIVAAPEQNTFDLNVGKVFVLSGIDGREIWSWGGDRRDILFGTSVAGGGDVDADGFQDVIIGSRGYWGEDRDGREWWGYGRVFVYSGRSGQRLESWGGDAPGDGLGWSASAAGDVDGDGFDDVLSGAPGHDQSGNGSDGEDAGQVVLFSGDPCAIEATVFGEGLAGSGGFIPALTASGDSCRPTGVTISVRDALGGASSLLWVAMGTNDMPLAGGRFYPDLATPWFNIPIVLAGTPGLPGAGAVDLPTPDLHGNGGLTLTLQITVLDPGAARGVALSNGLELAIRP